MKSKFSVRLKTRRRELGMTVSELGDATGLTHGCISQYETGIREPSQDSLMMLSSVLRVTVDYLIGDKEYSMKDFLSDDRMFEVLEGFLKLSEENQNMLFTFYEALEQFERRKRDNAKIKMTEYGIPQRVRQKISGNGSLV